MLADITVAYKMKILKTISCLYLMIGVNQMLRLEKLGGFVRTLDLRP
jgi:hypothetical protein